MCGDLHLSLSTVSVKSVEVVYVSMEPWKVFSLSLECVGYLLYLWGLRMCVVISLEFVDILSDMLDDTFMSCGNNF